MPARYDGPCRKCGTAVVRDSQGERKCPTCFAVRKRQERQRAADRVGKVYRLGVPFWLASRISRGLDPAVRADRDWRTLELRNARETWRWWLANAPAWWLAARREHLVEEDTAYYRERYRADPAFRAREIARVAKRKAQRGRFGETVRRVLRGEQSDHAMRRMIGYGRDELLAHLVARFRPGMTVELLLAGDEPQ